ESRSVPLSWHETFRSLPKRTHARRSAARRSPTSLAWVSDMKILVVRKDAKTYVIPGGKSISQFRKTLPAVPDTGGVLIIPWSAAPWRFAPVGVPMLRVACSHVVGLVLIWALAAPGASAEPL